MNAELLEPALIAVAFAAGLCASVLRLPPMVGFLAAGFVLNALGFESTGVLQRLADLGVTLLLFTIGLKLDVRVLMRAEVWGAASLHILGSTAMLGLFLVALKATGLVMMQSLQWHTVLLLGFALSFSSTVFAVKVLEERSELASLYGRIAIGVLIMQDIFAVLFLTVSSGEFPGPWALALLLLWPGALLMRGVLGRIGHGDLQVLYGVFLALVVGYALFEAVGIKGDLGALVVGMLLAPHRDASVLARALFNLKELFLVCFFLVIGLGTLPTLEMLGVALGLLLILPFKSVLYLLIFSRFRLRTRTSLLSTLSLTSYSEFALIVGAVSVSAGWLAPDWMVVMSLALAGSFLGASPLNAASEKLYRGLRDHLRRLEATVLLPADRGIDVTGVQAVVLGVGKIGRRAYEQLERSHGKRVLGVDSNGAKVASMREAGFNVIEGDAVDSDFWERLLLSADIELVLLAMPHHAGNVYALQQLRRRNFSGRIAAIVGYVEEIEPLRRLGAHAVYHVYESAGTAFADAAIQAMDAAPTPP